MPKIFLESFVVIFALALFAKATCANVLARTDYDRFHSLWEKLFEVTSDVTQAMHELADTPALVSCLGLIHGEAQSASEAAFGVNSLIALSTLMKEDADELIVLRQLSSHVRLFASELSEYRKVINASMGVCAHSPIVNAKGQAVLRAFSELNQEATALSRRVGEAIPRP
jgi:hypothetical protein